MRSKRSSFKYIEEVAVTKAESGQPIAVLGTADYYPFGMQFPNQSNLDYRYAYQGQEKDEETNMEAFQLRLWDARIGRWLTPDPYGQYASPYLGMGNNPISRVDPDGGKDSPGDGWFKRIFNKIFGKTGEKTDGYIDEVVVTAKKIGKAVNESFSIKDVGVDVGAGVRDFKIGRLAKIDYSASVGSIYYNDDKERWDIGLGTAGVGLKVADVGGSVSANLLKVNNKKGHKDSFLAISAQGSLGKVKSSGVKAEVYNNENGWGGDTGAFLQSVPEHRMVDLHGNGKKEPMFIIGGTIKLFIKAKIEFNVDKFYSDMWGTGNIGTGWKKQN